MNIYKQFYLSIIFSKKILNFRLQKIGKTIRYIFFLSFIEQLIISNIYYQQSDSLITFLRDTVVIYLINTFLMFFSISFLAVIGLFVTEFVKRNLNYTHLWNIATYAITIPTIMLALLFSFNLPLPFAWLIKWFFFIVIMIRYITFFPKPRKRPQK